MIEYSLSGYDEKEVLALKKRVKKLKHRRKERSLLKNLEKDIRMMLLQNS